MIDRELVTRKLVLIYDEIDPVKVHEALRGVVGDVTEYLDRIRTFLDRQTL